MAKRVIVAVTGASGALYAARLIRALLLGEHEVHLVMSKYGRYLLHDELGFQSDEDIGGFLERLYGDDLCRDLLHEYGANDQTSTIASGSVRVDGMVVIPCSMKTLAGIAHGAAANLIERAADVTLKERRPLILVPRETPLNVIQLRNLLAVSEAGGIILPAMPAFYQKPKDFNDLGDFMAGRVCNLLNIDHVLFPPWGGAQKS